MCSNLRLTVLREVRMKAQAGCYVDGVHPSAERAWAVAGPRRYTELALCDEDSVAELLDLANSGSWSHRGPR
jgi:hypothetical protein